MRETWIIDAVRTPRGRGRPDGALHHLHPQRLLAGVLNSLKDRVGFDTADIDDVIMGCAVAVGDHGDDIARLAALDAGWNINVPGVTMNRFCGSGQQAVNFAAAAVAGGHYECVVAGGVEMMSRYDRTTVGSPTIDGRNPHLRAQYPIVPQFISAELIATLEGFSREDCDRLAAESQRRAAVAITEGRFARSMVAVKNDDGSIALDHEQHPRPGTTVEALANLKQAFAGSGSAVLPGYDRTFLAMCQQVYPQLKELNYVHTGGNSSGVVDGASAILICSPDYAKAHGLKPRARVVMGAVAGAEPVIMLTAPAPASRKCLARAGRKVTDIDLWEVNEAFASVVLKFIREMKVDPATVNVNGGAMALGHPIAASGPMLIMTALDELERQGKQTALITMCTGGGMGTATLIERI